MFGTDFREVFLMNLKTKIIFAALFAMILTVIAVIFQSSYGSYKQQLAMTQEQLKRETLYLSQSIDNWVENHVKVLEALAVSISDKGLQKSDIGSRLVPFNNQFDFKSFLVGFEDTKEVVQSEGWVPPADWDPHTRDWYVELKRTEKTGLSAPFIHSQYKTPALVLNSPLFSGGRFSGAVSTTLDMATLIKAVETKIGRTGYSFIIYKDGTIIANPDKSLIMKANAFDKMPGFKELTASSDNGIYEYSFGGSSKLLYYYVVPSNGWICAITIDKDEVLLPIKKQITAVVTTGVILSVICALVLLGLLIYGFQPLNRLVAMFKDVAEGEGDLTKRLDESGKDELSFAGQYFNKFVLKLSDSLRQVIKLSSDASNESNNINSTIEVMASELHKQAEDIIGLAGAMEEMNATVKQVAENANSAAVQAEATKDNAGLGKKAVDDTMEMMEHINDSVSESATVISRMAESVMQINEITTVISDIADQTNLLALNAAIEAARAGEHGRGFAVVADEVRKLAERTQTATGEISKMVKEVQIESENVNISIKNGVGMVEKGKDVARISNEKLDSIIDAAVTTLDMVTLMATASEEQAATTSEISNSISDISEASQKAEHQLNDLVEVARNLRKLSETLRETVGVFKID